MRGIRVLLLHVLLIPMGCKAQTALQLRDRLFSITDTLQHMPDTWGSALLEAGETGNYATLHACDSTMLAFIGRMEKEVANMKDMGNSKPLRQDVLSLLAYHKQLPLASESKIGELTTKTPTDSAKVAFVTAVAATDSQEGYRLRFKVWNALIKYSAENKLPPLKED